MSLLARRFEQSRHDLDARGHIRVLMPPSGHDFCSNDYLKLAADPCVIDAVIACVKRDGYGSSSSRFIRGEHELHAVVEKKLAHFKKSPSSIIFSSGYTANVGVLSSVIHADDIVFSDRLNHASIIDGVRLSRAKTIIFPHLDVDYLARAFADAPKDRAKFLVTESLFSMDGDIAPLDRYAELAKQFDVGLIVDEAHGVGLYGEHGAGLIDHFGVTRQTLISINGLGKAFGTFGAFVAGADIVIDYIRQRARTLMYSTSLPPLALAAIDAALKLVIEGDSRREKLFQNVKRLRNGLMLDEQTSILTPIIPLIIGESQRAMSIATRLKDAGFDVKAIRPPSVPNNSSRLRITTNVDHGTQLIDAFIHEVKTCL